MKVFLVHGSYGAPYIHWFSWLACELKKHDIPCLIPTFPTPEHQNYNDWKRLLNYYYDLGIYTPDTVFVGHSAGSICIARYLAEKGLKALGLITVAGYNEFYEDESPMKELNKSFYVSPAVLVKLKNTIKYRVNYVGDNDPFIPQQHFHDLTQAIGAEMRVIPNGGHINSFSGYSEFPQLLEYLLELNSK